MAIALILAEGEIGGRLESYPPPGTRPAGKARSSQARARGLSLCLADSRNDIGLGVADIGLEVQHWPPGRGGPQILEAKTQLQAQVRVEGPGHRWPVAARPSAVGVEVTGPARRLNPSGGRSPSTRQAQVQPLPSLIRSRPTRQVRLFVRSRSSRAAGIRGPPGREPDPERIHPPGRAAAPAARRDPCTDNAPPGRATARPPGGPGQEPRRRRPRGRRRRPG